MKNENGKTFYYKDVLNDDFARTKIVQKPIGEKFKYVRTNIFYRFFAFVLTYFVATPILYCALKLEHGLRIKNRKVLRKVKGKAFFLYGNHTQHADSYIPQVGIMKTRKTLILSSPDATSIKGLKTIVQMLGAVPLPDADANFAASKKFLSALNYYVSKKKVIAIYPEAHIWPYYTGIRPFVSNSFIYPVNYNAPVVAFAATYEKRRLRKTPRMVVTLSDVFYPDAQLKKSEAREKLRDEVYAFMLAVTKSCKNYAYYHYLPATNLDETNHG